MRLTWTAGFAALALMMQPSLARADVTPSPVVAKKVGAGWVFTDPKGMSLYTYGQDKPGQSRCVGACAALWPPVLAASDTETASTADWSAINRADGKKQIAYRGMPLYSYAKDSAPGTTFGDGVGSAWHVAGRDMDTPPGIAIGRGADGRALTDFRNRTLYVNTDDKLPSPQAGNQNLKSACTKHCLESWKPLIAPLAAVAAGDWSIAVREDGLRQWAFRQRPLYVPAGDAESSDQRQDGVWQAAVVEPAPPLPPWVTYQPTDGGELVADAAGFTVYALIDNAKERPYGSPLSVCDAACIRTYWRPIVAAPDAKPVGNWTILKGFDGVNQWAYRGELLFTHTRDTEPGEIAGARFFTRAWHTLTRTGQIMEGLDRS